MENIRKDFYDNYMGNDSVALLSMSSSGQLVVLLNYLYLDSIGTVLVGL